VDALKYQPTAVAPESPAVVGKPTGESSPGDTFVNAYFLVEAGKKEEQKGNSREALTKYHSAAALLEQISTSWPAWQPNIVKYRVERTAAAIAALQEKLGRANAIASEPKSEQPEEKADVQIAERTVLDEASKTQKPVLSLPKDPKSKIASELLTLKLRYKAPDGDTSKLLEFPLTDDGKSYERSSRDFRFAAAVASFGMLLRDSPHKGKANWSSTLELAIEGKGEDRNGYRAEFVGLIERAKAASR
jgi:hypothetical protein